ncbi:hypothetical protein [Marinilactibacillus psychrotolerans]|uniref:Uncharacterized protein n=1 Tax=Marinilactibacillus psychrotolerans 42ea TaxID=1255609 RepID=A0A1R4IZS4_9LACT|nr:hypothetical protein [Marinilactibacillus psychrotolerans]SJN25391.1 hypothetical protein FM115_03340 [Marinilactibacillus psychrotolerans 42ea]
MGLPIILNSVVAFVAGYMSHQNEKNEKTLGSTIMIGASLVCVTGIFI